MPLITVYIPTKSRHNLVLRAVNSVLEQDFEDFEIIVVDDTGDEEEVIRDEFFSNNKVRVYKNERSPGACGARNTAISKAKGKYITGLDDDDIFLPRRLTDLFSLYEKHKLPICSNYVEFFESSGIQRHLVLAGTGVIEYKSLLAKNCIGNQMFATLEQFKMVGGFDEKMLCWQDYDMWMRLLKSCGAAYKSNLASYQINIANNNSRLRISNDIRRAEGVLRFLDKYGNEMSERERFFHYLCYKQKKGNVFSFADMHKSIRCGAFGVFIKKTLITEIFSRVS